MAYERQQQIALERLAHSLAKLRTKVKNGQTREAIQFMEQGELKERFEELQNIITIAGGEGSSGIGASGSPQTGMFQ